MWIAQISDPHVRQRGVLYKGVLDTNAALAAAVAQINALDPSPDLVVLTGDVVDEVHPNE
jgi:Icc protein